MRYFSLADMDEERLMRVIAALKEPQGELEAARVLASQQSESAKLLREIAGEIGLMFLSKKAVAYALFVGVLIGATYEQLKMADSLGELFDEPLTVTPEEAQALLAFNQPTTEPTGKEKTV